MSLGSSPQLRVHDPLRDFFGAKVLKKSSTIGLFEAKKGAWGRALARV
jgi:hypothetical protein